MASPFERLAARTTPHSASMPSREPPQVSLPSGEPPQASKVSNEPQLRAAIPTRYPWLLGGISLAFLGYLLFLQARSDVGENGTLRAISDVFVLAGATVGAFACLKTALWLYQASATSRLILARRAALGWALIAGAALAYALGQIIWTGYDAQPGPLPFPAAYDPFYLAVYPLSWAGIALVIPRGSGAGRARLVLDATTAVLSVLAVSWFFILEPTITSLSGSALEKSVALAYPLGDLSLCVAAALLLFGPGNTVRLGGAIGRLAFGVTSLAVTDSLYAVAVLQGTYHTGFLQDLGWPLAWLCIGWSALVYPVELQQAQELHLEELLDRPLVRSKVGAAVRASTPFFLAIATCALLVVEVAVRDTGSLVQVILVSVLLFLMPAIRQLLTLVDNFSLTERLQLALRESQRAFNRGQETLRTTLEQVEQDNQAFEKCIREVRRVQIEIAANPFSVQKAYIEGSLSPVAASLNLLLARIQHWAKQERMVEVLEREAALLMQALEQLSDGKRVELPNTRQHSTLMTGGALIAGERLQRVLIQRFQAMRAAFVRLGQSWNKAQKAIHSLEVALSDDYAKNPARVASAALELTEALTTFQHQMSQLYQQTQMYEALPAGEEASPAAPPTTGPLNEARR